MPGATACRLLATPKRTEGGSRRIKGGRINSQLCGFILQPSLRHKVSVVQLALAWLLQKSPVMLPIPGTSSLAHLEENMAAEKLQLSADERKKIEELAGRVESLKSKK
jgi:aryl-alcohol dehydrogenase-like predicted oxidoreductase